LGRSKGVKGRACGPLRAAPETLDPPFHSKSDQEGDVSENGIKHAKPVTAAIVLWNTVYLERATKCQGRCGEVQAIATAATGLACFIFRFLRRPQDHMLVMLLTFPQPSKT